MKKTAQKKTLKVVPQHGVRGKIAFWISAAFLTIVTIIAFEPALSNSFNHYDDQYYITDNTFVKSGLTWASIKYAFKAVVVSNWHPVTLISHMIDCQLFGLDPMAHHAMNLAIHCINALLLFYLLNRYSGMLWPSLITALLFAIHPLRVESVAWAAERKDLLSAMFFFLATLSYGRYIAKKSVLRYLALVGTFLLGLMSKPMLVTLPFVLLVLDYYPFNRYQLNAALFLDGGARRNAGRLILEKVPLFILSAIFCYVTFATQQADNSVFNIPFVYRFLNAFSSYLVYLEKLVAPVNLAVFYPHPYGTHDFSFLRGIASLLAVAFITAILVAHSSRRKHLLAAWLWYLGLLVPVIGFVQVGDQAFADRYTYLPMISITMVIVWSAWTFIRQHEKLSMPAGVALLAIMAILMLLTRQQTAIWKDDISLFSHAISVTKDNDKMHYDLGIAFRSRGRFAEALEHFLRSKELNPTDNMVYMDISSLYMQSGQFDEVIKIGTELIAINSNSWFGYYGRGVGYLMKSEIDAAKKDFAKALTLSIDDIKALDQIYALSMQIKDRNLADESAKQLISRYSGQGNFVAVEQLKRKISAIHPRP